MSESTPTGLNLPQLLVLLVISFLALRWYLTSRGNHGSRPTSQASGRPTVNTAAVEQLAQMFPQLDRRAIAWDLQRNGGSVQATTERVLAGRGLDTPPATFQPLLPQPAATGPAVGRSNGGAAAANTSSHPDLITRYRLQDKVGQQSSHTSGAGQPSASTTQGWGQNKMERQALLQRRREEMILAARKKMEEKEKQRAAGT